MSTNSPTSEDIDASSARSDSLMIYEHLTRLCEFRGATVTERVARAKFSATMDTDHYARITAERPATDIRGRAHLVIYQFSTYRYIDASSPKFAPFLERAIKARPNDDNEYNIILVTSAPIGTSIARIIAERREPGIIIEHFLASMFFIVVPEHSCVPKHTIVPRDEVAQLCREMHLLVSDLPCLLAGATPDPMAAWLGLRVGMVVRIDRPSETAGMETVYRRCA